MKKAENHEKVCTCGCVPNILSLFEMAELRNKRKKLLQEKEKIDLLKVAKPDENISISENTMPLEQLP
jgi:hypothetical protein